MGTGAHSSAPYMALAFMIRILSLGRCEEFEVAKKNTWRYGWCDRSCRNWTVWNISPPGSLRFFVGSACLSSTAKQYGLHEHTTEVAQTLHLLPAARSWSSSKASVTQPQVIIRINCSHGYDSHTWALLLWSLHIALIHGPPCKAGGNNLYFQHSQKSHTALNVLVSSSVAKKERKNEWGQLAQFPDLVV